MDKIITSSVNAPEQDMLSTATKNIRVYRCPADPDGIFTAVYLAGKSRYGHEYIRILPSDSPEYNNIDFFTEYIDVQTDTEKSMSVAESVKRLISPKAYELVLTAAESRDADRGTAIYRFLVYGFSMGPGICDAIQLPCVKCIFEISRAVSRESHYFLEFIRFREVRLDPPLLLATIEPHSHVLRYIMHHFADRFAVEWFAIFDKTHNEMAFHPKNSDCFIVQLSTDEAARLDSLQESQLDYVDLWKVFFENIAIGPRTNPKLQRNLMPLWYRKNLTEFN